ncbi:MAG: hypothetical protein SFZ03_07270 [Candidatus Melainabacteria bacterium]|nr:hypothetical protein [Candidatus Melainabacteria bacterium]
MSVVSGTSIGPGSIYGSYNDYAASTYNDYWQPKNSFGWGPRFDGTHVWQLSTSPAVNHALDYTNPLEDLIFGFAYQGQLPPGLLSQPSTLQAFDVSNPTIGPAGPAINALFNPAVTTASSVPAAGSSYLPSVLLGQPPALPAPVYGLEMLGLGPGPFAQNNFLSPVASSVATANSSSPLFGASRMGLNASELTF